MDAFMALLGQTIAVAALVGCGVIKRGGLFVVTDPNHVCIFDGERVHRLPDWAARRTVAAMAAPPAVIVEVFCRRRDEGRGEAVWS